MKNILYVLFLTINVGCSVNDSPSENNIIKKEPIEYFFEVCPEKLPKELKELKVEIKKLIPEDELFFIEENIKLSSKLKTFYDVSISKGKFYLQKYFKIDNIEGFVVFSDFGISNNFPCRYKLFLFVDGKFNKSINLSGFLGDSSELLIYKSRLKVDYYKNEIIIKRYQEFSFEDIFGEEKSQTEIYVEKINFDCRDLNFKSTKLDSETWNNKGFTCL